MKKLYPEIDPIEESFIDVDNGHRLHTKYVAIMMAFPLYFFTVVPGVGLIIIAVDFLI